jgi:Zn-dependent M28 family amino/carboxypeptidase
MLTASLALTPATLLAAEPANTKGFRKAVTLAGVREHQAAFQAHSDANGGNRVAGGPGYEASANYVAARAQAAGYVVTSQEFEFEFNADRTPTILQQTSPAVINFVDGVDFSSMIFSPNGDVTAAVYAVDLIVPPTPAPSSTSGCEVADFAGFVAGSIALVQRGTCTFADKAANAAAAGAVAVIVFNEGQPGRTAVIMGTLGDVVAHNAPVVGTTFAVGDALHNGVVNGLTGRSARVKVDRIMETRTTRNIIAETPGGDPNHVVVVGAHLDSVSRGPGSNDNGSGSATILEVAEVYMAQERDHRNKLRFMWYGAEEFGLLGSEFYVESLSQAERDKIELMLNFDMIGSPNFVRFVYDGNNSAFPPSPGNVQPGPAGSGAIEQVFLDYFEAVGLPVEPTPFNGRSDYGPFIAPGVNIPAGGLFTGAEGAKTAQEAAIYGGTVGEQYDPCYHLACDTFANNSNTVLDQMSDAVAHAVLVFAKRNFAKEPLRDPAVTRTTGSGGGGGQRADSDRATR